MYRLRVYVRDASIVDTVRDVCIVRLREEMPAMTFVVMAGMPEEDWAVMIEAEATIGQYRAP